ncbi:MAG: SusC/RagA family TonB-linked outer membrane protein [Prevotellaceae bacterium]|jgi:TonB-linked SusC/RagA family outer membrane protein|nr:SusC/RagA family TonB-linked outer membrane protein [Prevotellaceae bacterium]
MKKTILLALLVLLGVGFVNAQTRVTGKVTSAEDGSPLPFVTVVVKGTTVVSNTANDGTYTITVPDGSDILVFTFAGMQTLEERLGGRAILDVALSPDQTLLDEAIISAYAPVSKKGFTGAASVIKSETLKDHKVATIGQSLQGQASGVMVVGAHGQPGENPDIRIRGIGSINATQSPLIILDGVEYNGALSSINPNDIEVFTILKDANSTALYGSKAANGVVNITTKQSRAGETRVNFSASYGFSSRARSDYDYLSAKDYLEVSWEAYKNWAMDQGRSEADARIFATNNLLTGKLRYNPTNSATPVGTDGKLNAQMLWDQDWEDALTRTGKRQEYAVDVSGGSEKAKYLISLGYLEDEGVAITSDFKRYSSRIKVDANPYKWLKIGLNSTTSWTRQSFPLQSGNSVNNIYGFIRSMSNIYPAYERNPDGSLVKDEKGNLIPDMGLGTGMVNPASGDRFDRPVSTSQNPLMTTYMNEIQYDRWLIGNNGYMDINILDGLTFKTQLGYDIYELRGTEFYNPELGDGTSYGGRSSRYRNTSLIMSWINQLTYDKTFNNIHHINVIAGTNAYDFSYNALETEKRGFFSTDFSELVYGANPVTAHSTKTGMRNFNFISRVNYDLYSRYFISASLTRDGSSRFHKDHRWQNFWSVGAAWLITSEDFMASSSGWLDLLKLKFSYGTTGNQYISGTEGYFPYLGTYVTGWNVLANQGYIVGSLESQALSWESQSQLDLGLEFSFLNGTISGSFTYFLKDNKDVLFSKPLVLSGGISSIPSNIGEVKNQGVELDITGRILKTKDLLWTASVNLSHIKNEVVKLPEENRALGLEATGNKILLEGKNINTWYLREWAGVDPVTGDPLWYVDQKDADGNVVGRATTNDYSAATRYTNEVAWPKLFGGFQTSVSYKGFDLGVQASFSIGGKTLDLDKANLMHNFTSTSFGYQASADYTSDDVWRQPGDIGKSVPRIGTADSDFGSTSTRWLVKSDYLRINNITLGYTFKNPYLLDKIGFKGARVYVTGTNFITLFGAEGLDPEQGISGITGTNRTSALKSVSFGVNLNF